MLNPHLIRAIWLGLISCGIAAGQNVQTMEYMTASSPLKNGNVVTSQSISGQPISTVILPSSQPRAVMPTSGTIPQGNPTQIQITNAPPSGTYPYPGVQYQSSWYQPQGPVQASPVLIPGSVAPQAVWQVPTLGINSNTVLRPNVVALNVDSTAASTPPGLNIEVPQVNPELGGGVAPTIQYPTASAPSVWNPNATNKLQPLIKLRNMPPGTYLGQGIVGQPKAYVDGQPMRNFIRYIFP